MSSIFSHSYNHEDEQERNNNNINKRKGAFIDFFIDLKFNNI